MSLKPNYTIKTIWGLAKSPELSLTDELLHDFVFRETGKESIRKLSGKEITKVCEKLMQLKGEPKKKPYKKAGNPETERQRRKIYMQAKDLGWSQEKLNQFVKAVFQVDRAEWLNKKQCSDLIEALKEKQERRDRNAAEKV